MLYNVYEEKRMKETFKQRIQKGEPVLILMATIDLSRSQLEDALANGSYDAVYIDAQHRAFSEERLVEFCAITEELGMPTQMRIPHTRSGGLCGTTRRHAPPFPVV